LPADAPTAFFSYSRDDSEFALRLAEDLKSAGANVWLDQLDIQPGQRWARAVQDALNNSPRVLVILSPSAVDSTHVEDEVNFALEEHKTVIPVFYQDCKVPFQLRPFQYVDFRTDYARGLRVMLKTLGVEQTKAIALALISANRRANAAASAAPKESPIAVSDEDARKRAAEPVQLEEEERERLATVEKVQHGPLKKGESRLPRQTSYRLNKTMSNPKYEKDIERMHGVYDPRSVINAKTVLVVVGAGLICDLLDRPVAEILRDHIDRKGGKLPFHRGIVITDWAWYAQSEIVSDNAVIAIGGPGVNLLTSDFHQWTPPAESKEGEYPIPGAGATTEFFRSNRRGLPQVGLWGETAEKTREAVLHYEKDPAGLKKFLDMCWET